jgi:membrane-associated phospholipid phosphatase
MFAGVGRIPQAQLTLSKPPDDPLTLWPTVGWFHDAGVRIRHRWYVKMGGTVAIMTAFFVIYFWLLNHARSPVTLVPTIFIDRMIAFRPGALPLYISLWVYVPLAPALLLRTHDMKVYTVAVLVLSAVGFGIFVLWPTAIPKPDVDASMVTSIAYLKAVDASGNAFPSLHVAFAVFTAMLFGRLLREMRSGLLLRALNWLWCLGIIYSTIAIRQHVALDAVAGTILGAIGGCALLSAMGRVLSRP